MCEGEQDQLENLVMHAQGPIGSVRTRETDTEAEFDPMATIRQVSDAILGGDSAEPKALDRRQRQAREVQPRERLLAGSGQSHWGDTELSERPRRR